MYFAKIVLLALATGALAQKSRHRKGKPHHEPPQPKVPIRIPHKKPDSGKEPFKDKKPASYHGPGRYYIVNQATNTTMDLYYGEAGPDTEINGYGRTENDDHQIWNVVAAAQYHQVAIINSATGAIASCSTDANDDGLLQLKGGEVALDGKSLFTLAINNDKSVTFQNIGDSDLCIDLAGSNADDETPVLCYACHPEEGENQNWILSPVKDEKGPDGDDDNNDDQDELKI